MVIGDSSQVAGRPLDGARRSSAANGADALVFGSNTLATGDGAMSVGGEGGGHRQCGDGARLLRLGWLCRLDRDRHASHHRQPPTRWCSAGPAPTVGIGDIAASDAAQVGAVQMVTVDANGVLGRAPIAMEGFMKGPSSMEMLALSSKIGSLENDLNSMEARFRQGIAATVAMTPVQIPSEPGRFSYAINGSTYRGAYATGGSMMYRLNTRNPMAVGFGFSTAGGKNSAVRFGIAGEF